MQLRELLATPAIAGILGFFVGVAVISAIAWSRKLSTSSDPQGGIVLMMMAMMGGMLVSSLVLIAFVLIAPTGFLYFGLALAAGFLIGLGVIAVGLMRESYKD